MLHETPSSCSVDMCRRMSSSTASRMSKESPIFTKSLLKSGSILSTNPILLPFLKTERTGLQVGLIAHRLDQ